MIPEREKAGLLLVFMALVLSVYLYWRFLA